MKPNYKRIYHVTKDGRVYNTKTKRWLKSCYDPSKREGYLRVNLGGTRAYIHRILMECYYPTRNMYKLVVDHINGNRLDNRLCNLEWVTHSENIKRAYRRDK